MSLKETLLMPSTSFEMRGNLNLKEPKLIEKWDEMKLYEKMNANREGCEEYILHDGPPYANGNMHCGHMLNRLLKDFVVRYKNMAGYKTPFIFGWDTHGLPIENMVTKSGVDRKKTPLPEFRNICENYARNQVATQKSQIHRLGVLGDYDHPYLTLLHEYEARQIEVFATMALKGLIFKGLKPVYWSPSSESALAEAEVEYHDIEARTMYVTFDVADGKGLIDNDAKIVIWTTTPWTIPGNQAVTVNPKFSYGMYQTNRGKLVFLEDLKETLVQELGLTECELLKSFHGQDMEFVQYKHPLYERVSPIIVNSYVTSDSGTGLVHTAPDFGLDDFNACMKYGIKPTCPVDDRGYMHLEENDPLNGLFYGEANDKVVEMLEANGHLLKEVDIVHSYPHDWRTKKPVIFRATPQWFCSIEPIREDLLKAVHEIKWVPAWGEQKMVNMIKDRADWCISRQRVWGVPLPIIYNEDGSPILEEAVFEHIAKLIREHGSNIWFEKEAKDLLPEGYKNEKSPNGAFVKEKDIMDVWFDSGSSWNGTLRERGIKYPADLYLEGNDQYRGWFNASLILSMATNGVAPFKTCLTHGWVMDENWEKMSKSKGNGIDPSKIANQFGADILRLWAAEIDYTADVRLSEGIIKVISDTYRKIRNTFRFLLANLHDGDKPYVAGEKPTLSKLDTYILAELEDVKNRALACYEKFDFAGVTTVVTSFMSGDLSSFYLDQAKDALYCDAADSSRRKAIQYVVYQCAYELCLLLNPILSFTMDEVYHAIPGMKKESPQFEDMPKESHEYGEDVLAEFARFKKVRDVALKAFEDARANGLIGQSSAGSLKLSLVKEDYDLLASFSSEELASNLIVASVSLEEGKENKAEVVVAEGELCDRCRRIVPHTHEHGDDHICDRCATALKGE